jgi:exopolysaccharide biosynthesis polyprenyl glycosylphosphotransferase
MSVVLRNAAGPKDADAGGRAAVADAGAWALRYGRRLLVVDTVVVISAVFGAQLLWVRVHGLIAAEPVPPSSAQPYAGVYSACIVVFWLGALAFFATREPRNVGTGSSEYRRVIQAALATFGALAIVVYLFNLQLARGYFFIAFPVGLGALLLMRHLFRLWLCAQRHEGRWSSKVVLVGAPAAVSQIGRELADTPEAGLQVVRAVVPSGQEDAVELAGEIPVVGDLDTLAGAVVDSGADTVVITGSDDLPPHRIRELSWQLEPGQQHLIVAPGLTDIGGPRIHTRPVAGLPLIHVETPRYAGGKNHSKRLFDILAALGLIVVLSPVLAGLAIAIRLSGPGPVLFRQRRVGKNGETFDMLKFRSMVPDAEDLLDGLRERSDAGNRVLFKMRDDPRVTPLGRLMRRYSLDELPQLFNVLSGRMALIGPRPPLADEVDAYEWHVHRRFLVKPGVTGLWQVSGRSNLSWEESVRLDLYYVENWTLLGDIAILFRTARAVLARDGAY